MSVLVNKNSKVIVQGFTGSEGTFHASQMIEFGTNVVVVLHPERAVLLTSIVLFSIQLQMQFHKQKPIPLSFLYHLPLLLMPSWKLPKQVSK